MKNCIQQLVIASIALVVFSSNVRAQSPLRDEVIASARKINAANELVRAGKIAEAIAGYQEIQAEAAAREQLNYNLGVAEYRNGNIESAKARFTEGAAARDPALAARSRYNLGNCFYSDAIETAELDKPAATQSLRTAIGHYRGSLAAEPNNTDARANIELAVQLLKKLQQEQQNDQQQKQEQQDADQQKQNQQQNDQQNDQSANEDAPQENSGAEPSDSGQEQTDSDDSQSGDESDNQPNASDSKDPSSDSESEHQNEDSAQQEDSEDKESRSEESNQQQSPDTAKPEEQSSQNQDAQQSNSQQDSRMQDGNPQQAADANGDEEATENETAVPAGDLTTSGEQESDGKPNSRVGIADPNTVQGLMTKEEALKMLQAVRDRDMLRRLRQEQVERSRHTPTDRDW